MPYNLNMENIIIHNKTHDMLPSISRTILQVRYSEHVNSKSVQSSPIWRYFDWITNIFTHENTFEHVVWEMSAILSLPQCVEVLQADEPQFSHLCTSNVKLLCYLCGALKESAEKQGQN